MLKGPDRDIMSTDSVKALRGGIAEMVREKPAYRRLCGYAFDPSLSLIIDTVDINNIVYKVPWEEHLEKGPIGEYVEVLDYDPTVGQFYSPVDLSDEYILASDGLALQQVAVSGAR